MTYMYEDVKTWNPFKGCGFDCVYCEPSFKRQAKRQKQCSNCYHYKPHLHPERLHRIPKANLVFACSSGDICFAHRMERSMILKKIQEHPKQTFLLQTKAPYVFEDIRIPSNAIIGTTIETNRDTRHVSKAPPTEKRFWSLMNLICRKAVTIEPILAFDPEVLIQWIWEINPEIVWIGYANHGIFNFEEPTLTETEYLIERLNEFTDVRLKTIRQKHNEIKQK